MMFIASSFWISIWFIRHWGACHSYLDLTCVIIISCQAPISFFLSIFFPWQIRFDFSSKIGLKPAKRNPQNERNDNGMKMIMKKCALTLYVVRVKRFVWTVNSWRIIYCHWLSGSSISNCKNKSTNVIGKAFKLFYMYLFFLI